MQPEPKKHISPWIAWAIVALFAGIAGFSIWYYYDQVSTAYDNSVVASFIKKSSTKKATTTTTATTTPSTTSSATADWKTYTNTKCGYSIKIPQDYGTLSTYDGSYSPTISSDGDLINFGNVQVSKEGNSFAVICGSSDTYSTRIKSYQEDDRLIITDVKIGKDQNIEAKKIVFNKDKSRLPVAYMVNRNGNYYEIMDTEQGNSIIETVISTFQFTK